MKIKYESTIDEAIDAQLRMLELSKTAKKWKWEGLIFAPILFVGVYFAIPEEKTVKLIFAAMAGIMFVILYLGSYKKTLRKRMRKLFVEKLGTDKPVPSEYEFDEDGLIFRKLGTEIKFRWETVKEINENEKVLEFIVDSGGIAMIPKRIFENNQQKDEWLMYAKEKINNS